MTPKINDDQVYCTAGEEEVKDSALGGQGKEVVWVTERRNGKRKECGKGREGVRV